MFITYWDITYAKDYLGRINLTNGTRYWLNYNRANFQPYYIDCDDEDFVVTLGI